jgi:hypothetical protein
VPKAGLPSFVNAVKQSIMTLNQWIASGFAFAKNHAIGSAFPVGG